MVSSTFNDLERHRAALIKAIEAQELKPVAMEQDAALPGGTVIDSSLGKVRAAAAYVGLISHRYGNVPDSADCNPDGLSLTELEFREARRLGRPMLIFIMGADHDVKLAQVERDPEKMRKLEAFRADVKRSAEDAGVERVYKEFNSLREFESAAMQSAAELRRYFDESSRVVAAQAPPGEDGIPPPPALYAEPAYIGSHSFTGRLAELETLSDWAAPSEPHPVLLYEAIGGTGKSMLTWEWTLNQAAGARAGLAGRFWYSFYERGADMADFSRRALAYMTGQPLGVLDRKNQPELSGLLLRQLQSGPWLLVLDGLERVLVAYHRFDAAQVADEHAGIIDLIARRDPSSAIRPQDDDLLRSLAGAGPSKVLITSRLMPRALLNPSAQPIPGVLHQRLPGLRPADAEALVRACDVRGEAELIRTYLQRHCDCHPLVTGIVAGLVNGYLPDRGNFDQWATDPDHGGHLNLAELDLVQKRNHILQTAIAALPRESRELLAMLAMLSEAVDYEALTALNPYLAAGDQPPQEPDHPERDPGWVGLGQGQRRKALATYSADRERYERERRSWLAAPAAREAARQLNDAVHDLERRGLLQYDRQAGCYDLHPVVRGFASGGLPAAERDRLGQRAIDFFSNRSDSPYQQAKTLDDVRNGLRLVRTLLQAGRKAEAFAVYRTDLSGVLYFTLGAYPEMLSLIRPLFGKDWTTPAEDFVDRDASWLVCDAALALRGIGQLDQALAGQVVVVTMDVRRKDLINVRTDVGNVAEVLAEQGRVARGTELGLLELELAALLGEAWVLWSARVNRLRRLASMGSWADADALWELVNSADTDWASEPYRLSVAVAEYVNLRFRRGSLAEDLLAEGERLARAARNVYRIRLLHAIRGRWQLDRGELGAAVENLHEAIRLTHEAGATDLALEGDLALAKLRLDGDSGAAREEAARLSAAPSPPRLALGELWRALDAPQEAAAHALAAYRQAWADGPPYVDRYNLDRAAALLDLLGVPVPELPPYDPASDPPFPFEADVRDLIAELQLEAGGQGVPLSQGPPRRPRTARPGRRFMPPRR